MASKLNTLDVVVLCGGLGKRLRTAIGDAPKPMAAVNDEPFLTILLKYLLQQGFHRVILCTGYKAEVIEDHYRHNNLGLEIVFSREDEPLGTGGAVKRARTLIKSKPFIVMNGDSFCPLDFARFVDFHIDKAAMASAVLTRLKEKKDFGAVRVDGAHRITWFAEKKDLQNRPALDSDAAVNAGIYCFDPLIFTRMPPHEAFSIEYDVFPKLVGRDFFGFETGVQFLDIGTPDRYKEAQESLKKISEQRP